MNDGTILLIFTLMIMSPSIAYAFYALSILLFEIYELFSFLFSLLKRIIYKKKEEENPLQLIESHHDLEDLNIKIKCSVFYDFHSGNDASD